MGRGGGGERGSWKTSEKPGTFAVNDNHLDQGGSRRCGQEYPSAQESKEGKGHREKINTLQDAVSFQEKRFSQKAPEHNACTSLVRCELTSINQSKGAGS